jgi:hypothetical protein
VKKVACGEYIKLLTLALALDDSSTPVANSNRSLGAVVQIGPSDGSVPSRHVFEIKKNGAANVVTVDFYGSIDGVTWTKIGTTGVIGLVHVKDTPCLYIKAIAAAIDAGSIDCAYMPAGV